VETAISYSDLIQRTLGALVLTLLRTTSPVNFMLLVPCLFLQSVYVFQQMHFVRQYAQHV
jgi:hypothetical protein